MAPGNRRPGLLGPHHPAATQAVGRRRGLTEQLHALALQAYDQIIGLQLEEVPVDGCITKAPGGGEVAGRSPVDRGKQGRKRSIATEGAGIPLGLVAAGANRHDSPLLGPTLQAAIAQVGAMPEEVTARLDRGDDSAATRMVLAEFGFAGEIAHACGNSRIRGSAASTIDPAGARSYLGGPSAARARFTVFLETPHHPGNRLDRHPLRPIQPTDLRPVLHTQHPASSPARLEPGSRKGLTFGRR